MLIPNHFALCVSIFVAIVAASSFYDNPEQDPLPAGGDSQEELLRKWDFEVRFSKADLFCLLFVRPSHTVDRSCPDVRVSSVSRERIRSATGLS